jgi:peroxiredoxin
MSAIKWLLPLVLLIVGCETEEPEAPEGDTASLPESSTDSATEAESVSASGAFGPDNGWWHADASDVPAGLSGTGYRAGDTAHDFTLVDQHGDRVQLYQFYGQVIVLEVFVEWCYTCQGLAEVGQQLWEELEDDGFVYLAVMVQGIDGGPPEADAAATWASRFDLTHPVLTDMDATQDTYAQLAYPTIVIIDRDMSIIEPDFWPMDPMWIAEYVLTR